MHGGYVYDIQVLHTTGMEVHDPWTDTSYTLRVYLGLVSADTPARNALAGTLAVAAYNADFRSQWSGIRPSSTVPEAMHEVHGEDVPIAEGSTDLPTGTDGMYCVGYSKPAQQTWMQAAIESDELRVSEQMDDVFANDPRLVLDDAMAQHMAECVQLGLLTQRSAGRKCLSTFAQLPYFDMVWSFALPWMHAGILGVVKRFWKCLFGDVAGASYLKCKLRKEDINFIEQNGKGILVPSDITRGYACICKYKGKRINRPFIRTHHM